MHRKPAACTGAAVAKPDHPTSPLSGVSYNGETVTTDERLARIEHVTAGIAEERKKDRDELRGLWRDTQRQLDQLTGRVGAIAAHLDTFIQESRAADQRLAERIEETDKRLGERIETMISAMGGYIRDHAPTA